MILNGYSPSFNFRFQPSLKLTQQNPAFLSFSEMTKLLSFFIFKLDIFIATSSVLLNKKSSANKSLGS